MGIEKTMSQMPKKKQISRFMWLLILLSCAIFFLDYDERVLPYNSTILAFSYKYGFISRGLAGTIYQWIDHILPVNMIDYAMVLRFTLIVTLAFYVLFFAFCYQCMKRCQEEYLGRFLYLILFYAVFVVSMFAYKRNFGRLDLYLMALTVIGTMCLIAKKAEWLIVPLSMISVMYHQGYVFMFYNILLALLVYRLLSEKEKQTERYPVSPQAETDEAQFVLTRRWGVRRRASSPPKSLRSSSPCSSSRRGPWWTRLHSCEYTGPWRRQASPSRWRPSARYSSQSASRGRRTPCRWGSG